MQVPSIYSVTIEQIAVLAEHILHISCVIPHASSFSFQAGQYGTVIINQTTRRPYSFCSDPKKRNTFEFVIDTKPGGPGSQFFLSKHVGDTMQVLAPLGTFVVVPSTRKKVFVATGTGIAPLRSMILDAIGTTPMALYWGLRHETDMYWQEEFIELTKKYSTFSYHVILSQPKEDWNGNIGHVTAFMTKNVSLSKSDVYLCGNKNMISEMELILQTLQVNKEQITTEVF